MITRYRSPGSSSWHFELHDRRQPDDTESKSLDFCWFENSVFWGRMGRPGRNLPAFECSLATYDPGLTAGMKIEAFDRNPQSDVRIPPRIPSSSLSVGFRDTSHILSAKRDRQPQDRDLQSPLVTSLGLPLGVAPTSEFTGQGSISLHNPIRNSAREYTRRVLSHHHDNDNTTIHEPISFHSFFNCNHIDRGPHSSCTAIPKDPAYH